MWNYSGFFFFFTIVMRVQIVSPMSSKFHTCLYNITVIFICAFSALSWFYANNFRMIKHHKLSGYNFRDRTEDSEETTLLTLCFKPKLQSPDVQRSAGNDFPLWKLLFSLMLLWEEVFVVLGTYELDNSGNCWQKRRIWFRTFPPIFVGVGKDCISAHHWLMVRIFFIGSLLLTASSSCLFSSLWTCCYRALRNRLKSCMQQMSSTSSLLMLLFPLASFSTSESIFFPLHLELILYALTAKLFAVGVKHHICPSLKLNIDWAGPTSPR